MKKRKASRSPKKRKSVKFSIRFILVFTCALLAGSLVISVFRAYLPSALGKATAATASIVGIFLRTFGFSATCQAQLVALEGFSFEIIDECLGAYEVFIFSAGVLAYPTGIRKKLLGISLGSAFLYFINIVRLSVLGVVGLWSPDVSRFLHLYLWQIILFLTVLLTCVLWIRLVVHPGGKEYQGS